MDNFKQFLIRHQVYNKFIRNLYHNRNLFYEDFIKKEKEITRTIITYAFDFHCSNEGSLFWIEVDQEWRRMYDKIYK